MAGPSAAPAGRTGVQPAGVRALRAARRRPRCRRPDRRGVGRPATSCSTCSGAAAGSRGPRSTASARAISLEGTRARPAARRDRPPPARPAPPRRRGPGAGRLRAARVQPQDLDHRPLRQPLRDLRAAGHPRRGHLVRRGRGRGRQARRPAARPQALPLPGLPRPAGRRRAAPGAARRERPAAGPRPRRRRARGRSCRPVPGPRGRRGARRRAARPPHAAPAVRARGDPRARRGRPPRGADRGGAPPGDAPRARTRRAASRRRPGASRRCGSPAATSACRAAAHWRERNPWLAFEDGVRLVRGFVQRLESGAWGPVPARLGDDLRSLVEGSATAMLKQGTSAALGALQLEVAAPRRAAACGRGSGWSWARRRCARSPSGSPGRTTARRGSSGARPRRRSRSSRCSGRRSGRRGAGRRPRSPGRCAASSRSSAGTPGSCSCSRATAPSRSSPACSAASPRTSGSPARGCPRRAARPAASWSSCRPARAPCPAARGPGRTSRCRRCPGGAGDPDVVPADRLFAPPERDRRRAVLGRGRGAGRRGRRGRRAQAARRAGELRRACWARSSWASTGRGTSGASSGRRRRAARRGRARPAAPSPARAGRRPRRAAARARPRRARRRRRPAAGAGRRRPLVAGRARGPGRGRGAARGPRRVGGVQPALDRRPAVRGRVPGPDRGLFIGPDLPDEALVRACLDSYRSLASTPDRAGHDRRPDAAQPGARRADRRARRPRAPARVLVLDRRAPAAAQGRRRSRSAERLDDRELAGPPYFGRIRGEDLEDVDVIWYVRGRAAFLWEVEWTAMLGDTVLRRHARMPPDERVVRFLVVLPERGRARPPQARAVAAAARRSSRPATGTSSRPTTSATGRRARRWRWPTWRAPRPRPARSSGPATSWRCSAAEPVDDARIRDRGTLGPRDPPPAAPRDRSSRP